ncbi:MAG: hypothetical protein GY754_09645 [bacterium]|nr:hypothetical protein [bacterium]
MKKKIFIIAVILLLPGLSFAVSVKYGIGGHLGFIPEMGNELHSSVHESGLGVTNGIKGINRSKDGLATEAVSRLFGLYGGAYFKVVVFNYFLFRAGADVAYGVGGSGITLDAADNLITVSYSMWFFDVPLTVGLSVPFWKDVTLSFSCGLAFAYGNYSNSFSAPISSEGSFADWTVPLVIILEGEYYLTKTLALTSSVSYFRGATTVIKSASDYASVDFTAYRWSIGACFYIKK